MINFTLYSPLIARWPSDAFYGGKLRDGCGAADRPAPRGFKWPVVDVEKNTVLRESFSEARRLGVLAGKAPSSSSESSSAASDLQPVGMAFVHVHSQESGAMTKENQGEIDVVVDIVNGILAAGEVPPNEIGVISPYSGQVSICLCSCVWSYLRYTPFMSYCTNLRSTCINLIFVIARTFCVYLIFNHYR
jgi:superfamily I DNA and/or RNA helicase